VMVVNANRRSTADFAAQILIGNKSAIAHFAALGMIWEAAEASLMPAG
jgi:hypothetical protein